MVLADPATTMPTIWKTNCVVDVTAMARSRCRLTTRVSSASRAGHRKRADRPHPQRIAQERGIR